MNRRPLDFGVTSSRSAIVLGNGPSLKGFDFARLRPFDVFGMNAAYRYWDEIGWYPRFYSCLDAVVGMSHAGQIARLIRRAPEYHIERFLLRRNLIDHLGRIENRERIVDFDRLRSDSREFARLPLTTGSHTLIWAGSLGFREIYILGVDCDYVEVIPGADRREGIALEITSASENPNYFFPGYQQVGDKYNIPNPSPYLHLDSWRAAAISMQEYGVRVLNANLRSRVDAFDFCRFEDVERGKRIEVIPRSKVVGVSAAYVPSNFASHGSSGVSEVSPRAEHLASTIGAGESSSPAPVSERFSAGAADSATSPPRKRERTGRRVSRLARRPLVVGAVALAVALVAAAVVTRAMPESWLGGLAPGVLFCVIAANLLFSALASWAVYAFLRSRYRSVRKAIEWRMDDFLEQLKGRSETLERIERLVSAQVKQEAETQEQVDELINRLKDGNR